MKLLLAGLLLFFAVHTVGVAAPAWRERMLRRVGVGVWKGLYSLASLIGLVAAVWGFSLAREQPWLLWAPPVALRHVTSVFMLAAFVLWAAAYVPGNRLKARVRHPMVLGVGAWALSHLLVGGNVSHVVLFGGFLVWAAMHYALSCWRDRQADGVTMTGGRLSASVVSVLLGVVAWAVFAFGLHGLLIGIKPLG